MTWRRHQMETFSALLAVCAGNSPVTGEFATQRPVARSFDVFFDLRLNERWSKSWGWWLKPSRLLWRHSNELHPYLIWQYLFNLQPHFPWGDESETDTVAASLTEKSRNGPLAFVSSMRSSHKIRSSSVQIVPVRRQAIIGTNTGLLTIWALRTYFAEIWTKIHQFSLKEKNLCFGLNILKLPLNRVKWKYQNLDQRVVVFSFDFKVQWKCHSYRIDTNVSVLMNTI